MRTRSSSNLPVVSPSNLSTSNPKRRNRRRSKQPFILEESPIDTMADQRTMAELLRAPTEGYAEAIVVPSILAEQFELKHSLINMMTSDQLFRLEKDNPHDHIRWILFPNSSMNSFPPRTTNLRNEISNFQQRFDESFHGVWDRYKDLLRACPHHGFTELHQLDTFYNALNPANQDSLNAAVGGNLLERRIQDVFTIIENKSKCLATDGNTFLELRDNIQGYVSTAAVNHNQGEYECVEETLTDQDLSEYTIKVLPPPVQKYKPSDDFCDGDERLTLNMGHDTSSYSNQPRKESINLINVFNNSSEDFLEDLFSTNQPSGNLTFSSHPELTLPEVKDDIFDPEGGNVLPEKLLDLDSTKDLHPPLHDNPLSGSTTYSSSPNQLLEEFVNELALIRFPLEYDDDLTFDIESDFKEIEYLLHHDPIKDIDSSLKDSIDQSNLADLDNNLVDSMPEMFTDEHALAYSSLPIFDEYDDDLLEVESDTENVYDDPSTPRERKSKSLNS
nr:hypothetical protein [Tanacetum cinerariifolium]